MIERIAAILSILSALAGLGYIAFGIGPEINNVNKGMYDKDNGKVEGRD